MVGLAAKQSRIRNMSSTVVKVKQTLGRRYDGKYFLRCGNQEICLQVLGKMKLETLPLFDDSLLESTPVGLLRNSILANRSGSINECRLSFTLGHLCHS